MKVIRPLMIGLLSSGVAMAAYGTASTTSQEKECIDAFVSQQLDGRDVDVRVFEREYVSPMPLILRTDMDLQLTAIDKSTGRTIATASCDSRRGLVEVRQQ